MRRLGIAGAGRVVAGGLLLAAIVAGTRAWDGYPDIRRLASANPDTVAVIERERELGDHVVTWTWVPLHNLSPHLLRAILVAEDIDFFSHSGFSWPELRAALSDARGGARARGASTITQQLAKNLWLSPERTVSRKLKEAVLAAELERRLSKGRILELYVNLVPFGPGVFGAEAAAQRYFGKAALFLTERESAELAAALSRPSQWNPRSQAPEYQDRVSLLQRRMAAAEFLWRHLAQLWYRR